MTFKYSTISRYYTKGDKTFDFITLREVINGFLDVHTSLKLGQMCHYMIGLGDQAYASVISRGGGG